MMRQISILRHIMCKKQMKIHKFVVAAILRLIEKYFFIYCKQFSLNCELKDLNFLGPGVPLFFAFLKSCIVLLSVLFLT